MKNLINLTNINLPPISWGFNKGLGAIVRSGFAGKVVGLGNGEYIPKIENKCMRT